MVGFGFVGVVGVVAAAPGCQCRDLLPVWVWTGLRPWGTPVLRVEDVEELKEVNAVSFRRVF